MPAHWEARDRKLHKRSSRDMVVSNRSIFVMDQANSKRNAKALAKAESRRKREKERNG